MRIIAGKAKGRTLVAPRARILRPTSDRVRESLFNILAVEGKSFLDLFAGAGGVGIEALSRGAARVVFVESNRVCAEALRQNLGRCGFRNMPLECAEDGVCQDVDVVECSVDRAMRLLSHRGERFDVIFADPPYDRDLVDLTLRTLRTIPLLQEGGIAVIQHSTREEVPAQREGYRVADRRQYGETTLSFLKRNDIHEEERKRSADRKADPDG
jgi:16S rRNA (guanine(966)-N(2))-methyltransferase RsmD